LVPPLRQQVSSSASYLHASQARLALYLMPQALPLAVPLGFMLGVFCGYGRCLVSSRSRVAVLVIALVCSAGSFVTLAWIAPAENQAFRVAVFGRDVVKGAPELTLGELRQLLDFGAHEPMGLAPPRDRRFLAWQYDFRCALSCAPLALAWFALSVIGRRQRGTLVLLLCACAAVFGYYVCIWGARRFAFDGTLPVFATVWFPNVACGVVSAVLMAVDSQRSSVASCP
jgi:lipopolysaccharide export LptBFGC system permease protein LptF